jgi:hypothetical protein
VAAAAAAAAAVGGGDADDVVCAHTALSLLSCAVCGCGEADLFLFDGTGSARGREEEELFIATTKKNNSRSTTNFVFLLGFFPFGELPF